MLGNTFGRMFRVTACGESYGKGLAVIVDGVPAGLELCNADIQTELDKRRPGTTPIDSPRQETDIVDIFAGVMEGKTTGAPVGMIIYNVDTQQVHVDQYRAVKDVIRPGHAEWTFFCKYGDFADWCGAGRASGRETCVRVAAGALAKMILARDGIEVIGYVKEVAGIAAKPMTFEQIKAGRGKNIINCPDLETAEKMIERILEVKSDGDTVGGIIEIIARGVPAGVGEPVFDKISAQLAHGLMSIGAVKGVEIGEGFGVAKLKGSECNDIPYINEAGKVSFRTNRAGGVEGGITNGEDIVARIAVKPTATISIAQDSVDVQKMEDAALGAITRRDPTICGRVVAVAEAMTALTVLDQLMMWHGYDSMQKFEHRWP